MTRKSLLKWPKPWVTLAIAGVVTLLLSTLRQTLAPESHLFEPDSSRQVAAESGDITSFRQLLTGIISASETGDVNRLKESLATNADGLRVFTRHKTYDELAAPFQMPQFSEFLNQTDTVFTTQLSDLLVDNEMALSPVHRKELNRAVGVSREAILEIFPRLTLKERQQLLDLVPAPLWKAALKKVDTHLEGVRIDTLPGFDRLDISRGSTSEGLDPNVKRHLGEGIKGYFREMPLKQRRAILIKQLELEMDAPLSDRIAAILEKTGPVVQKLFQLIGKEYPDPLVKLAAVRLAENLEIIPSAEVKRVIESRYGKPITELFKEFDLIPIGSATIGQVHRAVLHDGTVVAVKVRRPGIVPKVTEEITTLKRVSPPELTEYWVLLSAEIEQELDLRIEAGHLKKGESYGKAKRFGAPRVQVPRLFRDLPPHEDIIVSEFMYGTSLKKLAGDKNPKTWVAIGNAFSNFAADWFWRAVGKDGFAHADLHDGNLRTVVETGGGTTTATLSLIDFGSSVHIPAHESNGFIMLGVAIKLQDERLFHQAIATLAKLRDSKAHALSRSLHPIFRQETSDWKQRTGLILYELLKQKVLKTASIIQLNRGLLFLDQHLRFVNERLDEIDPDHKYHRFSLDQAVISLGKLHEVYARYATEGAREDGIALDHKTVRNIMTAAMRAGVTNLPSTAWDLCRKALRAIGL